MTQLYTGPWPRVALDTALRGALHDPTVAIGCTASRCAGKWANSRPLSTFIRFRRTPLLRWTEPRLMAPAAAACLLACSLPSLLMMCSAALSEFLLVPICCRSFCERYEPSNDWTDNPSLPKPPNPPSFSLHLSIGFQFGAEMLRGYPRSPSPQRGPWARSRRDNGRPVGVGVGVGVAVAGEDYPRCCIANSLVDRKEIGERSAAGPKMSRSRS